VIAHEPPLLGLAPDPAVEALMGEIQDQLAGGDAEAGTRRFFEEIALGPGGWDLVPEPVQRAAIRNAQTFVDLREDPDWATLDVAALAALDRPILVTAGDTSPPWLRQTPFIVAGRAGIPTRRLNGAGHSPHLTHPEELVRAIVEFASGAALCGVPGFGYPPWVLRSFSL
jgi:pimeloyl-ACP methyl ester carboxylesterase